MSWWLAHNFVAQKEALEKRAQIIKALRCFFDERAYTEVQTPVLQICPVMDAHIHAFKTERLDVSRTQKETMYLQTSPEFDMKKLLVAGMARIFQICPVFRNAEGSKQHTAEFTLLEWYHTGVDYTFIMDELEQLIRFVAHEVGVESLSYENKSCHIFKEWDRLSVCQAFKNYASIDLTACLDDRKLFENQAQSIGVRVVETDNWDDIFHAVMAEKIEPNLGQGAPTILYDYPLCMAALSRKKPDDPAFAERFELYICGVELANAFSELTDATEQRKRYKSEMALKQKLYGEIYPPDEEFFNALDYGMPECAGIALGVDRLVMLITMQEQIRHVQWAPIHQRSQ